MRPCPVARARPTIEPVRRLGPQRVRLPAHAGVWHRVRAASQGRVGHGALSASVQPDPARGPGAAQPDRPRPDGHQLVACRRRGQRARHPPPRRDRPGRHRVHHRRRDDARQQDRPADGHLPRGRRRQLHPGARPAGRGHASLWGEMRRPAPASGPPERHAALQHPRRERPRPEAPLVGRARDRLRERRGEGQGDPGGLGRGDPRADRSLLARRPGGSSRPASTPSSCTPRTATCCPSS